MEQRLHGRIFVCGTRSWFWIFSALFVITGAETHHSHGSLGLSAPRLHYFCPVGADVKLLCAQRGEALYSKDELERGWLFTPHSDQHCKKGEHPRHVGHFSSKPGAAAGLETGFSSENMWILLHNVTAADQGRYCCLILDVVKGNKQLSVAQSSHSHIILHVTPKKDGSANCTVWDLTPSGGSVPVGLALAACILALLSLPLILMLVYKQRHNAQSSRRAQELVRMDSETQGHGNPVFLGDSPQTTTRTVSQIMTRQPSETGRHLLSDPGTPITPFVHGNVFFPAEDTIIEASDLVQV